MKVEQIYYTDEDQENERVEITIDGENVFNDMCQCPEDNTYYRDHSCVTDIIDLLEKFYKLGKDDQEVEFSSIAKEDEEDEEEE